MKVESFLEKFPVQLNTQQKEAVRRINGPVLLLAVPGSGKTTVLVARLGYMIYGLGINPSSILTLTYTVAATNDMKERFCGFFGNELGTRLEFRTINSICAGIIKYCGIQLGKEPYKLESDEKVLLGILSSIYQKYEAEYPTESDIKGIKSLITYIKNMMLSEKEILALEQETGCHLLAIYQAYCKELESSSRMDYDDQMVYAYRLLRAYPRLLEYYQNMYPYICVDEAQDTSKIQHKIIALLASKNENLFMVGDEDQSIYGFRAAYPEALLSFEEDHKGAKVLLMEENFRSNANVVEAADAFIQKNTLRHEKHMKATKTRGSEIKEISLKSRGSQYSYLLKVAQDCREQTAVLYRDNESVIPLVDLLERNHVSYRVRSAELSFFTNRVVVDIQNVMRFSDDMKNADLFMKLYYKLSTYLNKQMAQRACEISRKNNISVFVALSGCPDINPRVRSNMKSLETHLNNMRGEAPQKAIYRIVKYMGYGDYMEKNGLSDSKVFIMKSIAGREETIKGFLTRMEELKDLFQNRKNNNDSRFILSTIHGSKGLEYDNVYMIDVLDGIFPDEIPPDVKRADKETVEKYEEERRIFYVGVTRAKNNLYLFKSREASTFINQLLNKKPIVENVKTPSENKAVRTALRNVYYFEEKGSFSEEEYKQFVINLAEGVIVSHKKYGRGVIVAMDETNVTILFDNETQKKFSMELLFKNKLLKI
jgi:DNA helicase-2/ATP-dependent DNA helicase PcrA